MPARDVLIRLRLDNSDFGRKLTAAEENVKGFIRTLESSASKRQALAELGGTFGKVGISAALAGGVAVKSFADFDEAMSFVAATGEDARRSIEGLRQAALDAGARTQYSATEAAGAIENLAKAGLSATEIIDGGLDGALDLAAAGGLQVADAAQIAAIAIKQFNLQGSDVPHVADLLAAGAGKAVGDVTDLGAALGQTGLVANQTGLSIEETTAGLSAFAAAGLLGSDAGTSFKSMLQRLTPQSAEAQKLMDKLGISAYDAQGNFVGLAEFAGNLQTSLKDLTPEQRNSALATIFGSDAVRAASVIYEQGEAGIREWTKAVNDQGFAAETAAVRMDNLKGDVEQLKGALETAFIGTGEGADSPLRSLTQGLTDLINLYNDLPGPAKAAVLGVAGVTSAVGLGGFAIAKGIGAYIDLKDNLNQLADAAPGAARGLRAVAIAAAAVAAIQFGSSIGDSIDDRDSKEVDALAKSLRTLGETGKATGDLKDLFGDDLHGKTVRFGKDLGGIGEAIKSLDGYADDSAFTETLKFFGSAGQSAGIVKQAEAIQDLDTAFGRLASNDPEAAIASFNRLKNEALATGASADDINRAFPSMVETLRAASEATGGTADATKLLNTDLTQLGPAAQEAAQQMAAAEEVQRGIAESFIDIGETASDAEMSLGDFIGSLEEQAEALEKFTENAVTAAERGLDQGLIASLEALGPAGAMRLGELANASDAEIARANQAWERGELAIQDYIDKTGKVPPGVGTHLSVTGVPEALRQIGRVLTALSALPGMGGLGIAALAFRSPKRRALGGPVFGPGSATSDSIPAMLSNGEHVWTAREVERAGGHGAMYAMRAAAMGAKSGKGYADGGAVGQAFMQSMPAFSPNSTTPQIASLDLAGLEIGFDRNGLARIVQGEARVVVEDARRQENRDFRLRYREGR